MNPLSGFVREVNSAGMLAASLMEPQARGDSNSWPLRVKDEACAFVMFLTFRLRFRVGV